LQSIRGSLRHNGQTDAQGEHQAEHRRRNQTIHREVVSVLKGATVSVAA
jgi:hypothetical protein